MLTTEKYDIQKTEFSDLRNRVSSYGFLEKQNPCNGFMIIFKIVYMYKIKSFIFQ